MGKLMKFNFREILYCIVKCSVVVSLEWSGPNSVDLSSLVNVGVIVVKEMKEFQIKARGQSRICISFHVLYGKL